MDAEQRQALIARYKDGHQVVAEALRNTTEAQLDAHPTSGEWSVREIVHHLADSEMTAALRLRRLLAEESPAISGYDEEEFARRLHYERPIAASLRVVEAVRHNTAEILDRLTEAEWARTGTHSEAGAYSVERWLEIYAAHCHDHAAQIQRARDAGR
ncbi:MAG: DinB family protein [Ktedonobacterales bacterium]|nr:DinB family protein [Ktedonobacterales bacterium]